MIKETDGDRFEAMRCLNQELTFEAAICVSEQMKENNNIIRNLTREYKQIEPECREGVREKLERMKELCRERNSLYEKQNDLKGQKWKLERALER